MALATRPDTSPAEAAAPKGGSRPARDPWPDNAKLVLIVLVAIGHMLSKGITARVPAAHALYVWIYLFHMPAFIFLAGFFSGTREISARSLRGIVTRLLVPYVVFTVLYSVAVSAVDGEGLRVDLVNPYWLLWFLPALAAWRLLTPIYLNLRWPLAISVVIGLGAGMLDRVAADFTLSRILALAPFFVLGALATPERLRILQRPLPRLGGAAVLLTTFTAVALLHEHIGTPGALFWDEGYESQGLGTLAGFGARMLMYVIGTVLLLAVLAVVPTRRSWLTGIGAASLYVYLLHGFLVRGASSFHLLDHVQSIVGIAVLVVLTTGVCVALGSPPVRKLTRPLIEPRLTWLTSPHPVPNPVGPDCSHQAEPHWSKSSTTSSETGDDWQASTKPDSISSGSRA
jgi:fucose 4-O-acetylase-like acetyltransferase